MDIKLNDFKKLKGKFRNFKMLNTRFTLNGKIRGFLKDRFKTNLDMRIIDNLSIQNWSSVFRNSFIDDNIMVLSTPIFGYQDEASPIGVLNIVLNQEEINRIVQSEIEKIGKTAQIYIVDDKGMLLTDTLKNKSEEIKALNYEVKSKAVDSLIKTLNKGEYDYSETKAYKNFQGKKVIGTVSTVNIGDSYSGIITEIEENEGFYKLYELRNNLILVALIKILKKQIKMFITK